MRGVWFDDRHVGNPLVFCGVVGVMPRAFVHGDPKPGDRIIAVGGRTGRDGIHGATFSSAELSDTHADEFSHAVQIGNPIVEKKTISTTQLSKTISSPIHLSETVARQSKCRALFERWTSLTA